MQSFTKLKEMFKDDKEKLQSIEEVEQDLQIEIAKKDSQISKLDERNKELFGMVISQTKEPKGKQPEIAVKPLSEYKF